MQNKNWLFIIMLIIISSLILIIFPFNKQLFSFLILLALYIIGMVKLLHNSKEYKQIKIALLLSIIWILDLLIYLEMGIYLYFIFPIIILLILLIIFHIAILPNKKIFWGVISAIFIIPHLYFTGVKFTNHYNKYIFKNYYYWHKYEFNIAIEEIIQKEPGAIKKYTTIPYDLGFNIEYGNKYIIFTSDPYNNASIMYTLVSEDMSGIICGEPIAGKRREWEKIEDNWYYCTGGWTI
jgi:hypothetical protein